MTNTELYINRYCEARKISETEAREHIIVKEVSEYYKSKGEQINEVSEMQQKSVSRG